MKKAVGVVFELLSLFVVSFFLQVAVWALLYGGHNAPLKFFAIISVWADALAIVVYALYSPAPNPKAEWKPVRSVDEHGAEFMTEQETIYRFRRLYPNGRPTYPN